MACQSAYHDPRAKNEDTAACHCIQGLQWVEEGKPFDWAKAPATNENKDRRVKIYDAYRYLAYTIGSRSNNHRFNAHMWREPVERRSTDTIKSILQTMSYLCFPLQQYRDLAGPPPEEGAPENDSVPTATVQIDGESDGADGGTLPRSELTAKSSSPGTGDSAAPTTYLPGLGDPSLSR